MARLPRGVSLSNPRTEGNAVVYDLCVAPWRLAWEMLKALRHVRVTVSR